MAGGKCPECGKFQSKGEHCPNDGAKLEPSAAQGIGCLIVVVIAALIGVYSWIDSKRPPDNDEKEQAALVACEEAVTAQLKAPSTADFADERVVKTDGGFRFTGAVDSENSFGAKVRARWICTAVGDGADYQAAASILE